MIFFRYHHSILDINTKKIYLDNFHYDNYHNLKTNTFWIPLCDINQSTGGLVFYSDNKNNTKKNPIVPTNIPTSTNVGENIVQEEGR